jgi:EAL domain-containing protein (putative c-di-GMP-specific phosphodiesterase class I)
MKAINEIRIALSSVWCFNNGEPMALEAQKKREFFFEDTSAEDVMPRTTLYYQPVVDSLTSQVMFCESLLRFLGPKDGEIMAPAAFIQKAETDGSIASLDADVLSRVFQALASGPSLVLSLNVSCHSLEGSLWSERFYEGARSFPKVLSRMIIEITETCHFSLSQGASAFLKDAQSMGARLALDDVDEVSLSCLKNHIKTSIFSVDYIKISRHLTMSLVESPYHHRKFSDLLSLARDHGIAAIVEGVETKRHCDALCAQGVSLQQGYYWGHPSPVPFVKSTLPV